MLQKDCSAGAAIANGNVTAQMTLFESVDQRFAPDVAADTPPAVASDAAGLAEMTGEGAAAPFDAVDRQRALVSLQRVLARWPARARSRPGRASVRSRRDRSARSGAECVPARCRRRCRAPTMCRPRRPSTSAARSRPAAACTSPRWTADWRRSNASRSPRPAASASLSSFSRTSCGRCSSASDFLAQQREHARRCRSAARLSGRSPDSSFDSSSRSLMIVLMRSAWRRISRIGELQVGSSF